MEMKGKIKEDKGYRFLIACPVCGSRVIRVRWSHSENLHGSSGGGTTIVGSFCEGCGTLNSLAPYNYKDYPQFGKTMKSSSGLRATSAEEAYHGR